MIIVVSGEGSSDIGSCFPANGECNGGNFKPGAMSIFIDQLISKWLDENRNYEYSHIEYEQIYFVSEQTLASLKRTPDRDRKKMRLRGKDTPVETGYYYANARALAHYSEQMAKEKEDTVIAILFRDADGTASASRGLWRTKWDSMLSGFEAERINERGIPMLPNPKSEAWLLCALKNNYQNCNKLEEESGNDKGKNPLKKQLQDQLEVLKLNKDINGHIENGTIDVQRIEMKSFDMFKARLYSALEEVL